MTIASGLFGRIIVAMVIGAFAVSAPFTANAQQRKNKMAPFTYSNPIRFQGDVSKDELRDPCIIREGDTYYVVFTVWPFRGRDESALNNPDMGSSPGIKLYSSKDLKAWKFEKWLVKSSELPEDCPYKHRFWAPEIHKINGMFYIIFTADNWKEKSYNPAGRWGTAGYAFVGVADKVTGPYKHITYIPNGCCDSTLFGDCDGKIYCIMPHYDISIQEIDLINLQKGVVKWVGEQKRVITPDTTGDTVLTEKPHYFEGPWVEKFGAKYVLFYAEPFEKTGYWTGVAYADSIMGPWTKDRRGRVFLGGHLAVFSGPDGRKWFSYRNEGEKNRGLLCVDPFEMDAEGRVSSAEPTVGPQIVKGLHAANSVRILK